MLIVLRCEADDRGVDGTSMAIELVVSFVPLKTPLAGEADGRFCGLGGAELFSLVEDVNSPLSSLFKYPQLVVPQTFAMRPPGMPPVSSVRPIPMPFSQLIMMAVELRLVGAGGLAKVLGASVLNGRS